MDFDFLKFSLTLSKTTTVSFTEYPAIVKTAATVERLNSRPVKTNKPIVAKTSWKRAKIADKANCHSKRNQMYKSIPKRATITAQKPFLLSSSPTVGPTNSVLLMSKLMLNISLT